MKRKKLYAYYIAAVVLMVAILAPAQAAGQDNPQYVTDDKYNNDYENVTIEHKKAKYYDNRGSGRKYSDTFDEDNPMINMNIPGVQNMSIQAAHTYIDTIYMHRGTSIDLSLPDGMGEQHSTKTYQRWYSFRTGKTFQTAENTKNVVDLLTPSGENASVKPYRFANGYVGSPVISTNVNTKYNAVPFTMKFYFPKSDEFGLWFPEHKDNDNIDDRWFIVACDVSSYTDYVNNLNESEPSFTEPTLSHRIIYYIHAIEDEESWFHKALDSNNFVETYQITFPATRIPSLTPEAVSLSKDARSYVLPEGTGEGELTVMIENNTAGISLMEQTTSGQNNSYKNTSNNSVTLTGEKRAIFFDYPTTNNDGTKSVKKPDDGSDPKATIIVKNGDKNIAKFELTFSDETRLLTQSMIEQLDNPNEEITGDWDKLAYRTPMQLHKRYRLLTELNFDYDEPSEESKPKYYPFPAKWEYCSYGFYDGSTDTDYIAGSESGTGNYPEWGWYGFTNYYVEAQGGGWSASKPIPAKPLFNKDGEKSSYHMYIDASDRPGVIARMPFREKLCEGSELFVTAWVKSARWGERSDNAAMLLTVMGVTEDGKYEPIYRCQTGQIPTTYQPGNVKLPGFKSNKNEWMQIYFSLVNKAEDKQYTDYVLQIDNNSASTNGGDIYIDDIRVYVDKLSAKMKQKKVTCDDMTLMNFRLDWNRLMSLFGASEEEGETHDENCVHGIDFCLVDKAKYESLTEKNKDWTEAIKESLMKFGNGTTMEDQFGTLYYKWTYGDNKAYNDAVENLPDLNNIGTEEEKYGFYSINTTIEWMRELAVDFYANLEPKKEYMILIKEHTSEDKANDIALFGNPDEPCTRVSSFNVAPGNEIRVNGEALSEDENTELYCTGQTVKVDMTLRYFDENGELKEYNPDSDEVYFDWFFGTMEEFIKEEPEGCSLKEALDAFRNEYPSETASYNMETDRWEIAKASRQFTKEHKVIIEKHLNLKVGERIRHLELHKTRLEIRLLDNGVDLVVDPLPTLVSEDKHYLICSEPSYLHLEPGGKAVQAQPGFEYMKYPEGFENPAMRIGLAQIKASNEKNLITVNLRNAEFAFGEDDEKKPDDYSPHHLGLVDGSTELYLIDSNDPKLPFVKEEDFDQHQYSIGKVTSFYAVPYNETTQELPQNKMEIYFDLKNPMNGIEGGRVFNPREGYEYTFGVHYEEEDENNATTAGSCYNDLEITMKVVPEYLVWQGDEFTKNWNNDEMWKRATEEELKNKNGYTDYDDGSQQEYPGYVPMNFSNVVMSEGNKVRLYQAGFIKGSVDKYRNLEWGSEKPENMEDPTDNIMYDMVVHSAGENNTQMATRPYSVNLCDEIHFEPSSEMMHAELLTYTKAWVDYKLAKGRWYALTSPLKGVVSGDFYTDKAGTEGSEYFKDINWNDMDNSRVNPSVYQRGWEGEHQMIGVDGNSTTRAISGNWSAVYNDAAKAYTPLNGFSLKVQDIAGESATFRLPKADKSYIYHQSENVQSETIERKNAGRLQISDLSNLDATELTVELKGNGNNPYYLVGNPFMSALNMEEFFKKNDNVAAYWALSESNQSVGVGDDNGLHATGTRTIAPLQSFFIKLNETATSKEVKFTADMQEPVATGTTDILTITATTADGRQSHAAVAYDGMASDDYRTGEDAELFLDSNLGDTPMVYTVAGTMATSINRTSGLQEIPLGVYCNDKQEIITLSFSGLNNFSSSTLYDVRAKTEIALYEGLKLEVPVQSSSRYFLRVGTPTSNEVVATNRIACYSSGNGRIEVFSADPLVRVMVYNMSGQLVVSRNNLNTPATCVEGLSPGQIYIVHAKTASQSQTEKVEVR